MSRVSRMGPTSVPPSSWFPCPLRHASFFRFLRPSALGCRLLPLPSALTPALFTPLPTFLCLCPGPPGPQAPRPPRPLLFASPSLLFCLPHSAVRFDPPPPPRPPALPRSAPPSRPSRPPISFRPAFPCPRPVFCPPLPPPPAPLHLASRCAPSALRPVSSAPHPTPPPPRPPFRPPHPARPARPASHPVSSALLPHFAPALFAPPILPLPHSAASSPSAPLAAVGGGASRAAAVSPPLRPGVLVIG